MQISFLLLLITFTITCVTADCEIKKVDVRLPVHRPEDSDDKNPNDVNVLLATLFEMHHNLLAQISLLEDKLNASLPTMEQSEIKHMVEHFTAQKDNIESSIQQIQSNDGLYEQNERSIAKESSSIETKSIPLFVNFFKRTQTPSAEQTNANTAYSLHSQSAPTYVYQAQSNTPIEYTQHGSQQPTSQNGQVYVSGGQSPVYYQEQPIQQINQQFVHTPQVMNHPQVQATLIEAQYQPQYHTQHPPQLQQQAQANRNEHELQSQINMQIEQQLQSQINQQFQQQQQIEQQQQQQIQHQPQPQTQQQFAFESVFRPSSVPVRRPQVQEHDTQRQSQFGHKEGIFVYYPNGVITDDKDRPTIANRFGQVFDRFGQAISNIGNRQPLNNEIVVSSPRSEDLPSKNKIKGSLLKIRNKSKKPIDEKKTESKPEDETKIQKEIKST